MFSMVIGDIYIFDVNDGFKLKVKFVFGKILYLCWRCVKYRVLLL